MRYNIETIKNIIEDKPETKIIYFWGHTPTPNKITPACLSQWFNCKFDVDNITYHTAEQSFETLISFLGWLIMLAEYKGVKTWKI